MTFRFARSITVLILPLSAPTAHAQSSQEVLNEIRAMRGEVRALRDEVSTLRGQLQAAGIVPAKAPPPPAPVPNVQVPASGGPDGTGGNAPFLTVAASLGITSPAGGKTPVPYIAEARYFQPFGHDEARFAFLAADRFLGHPGRRENQFDAGAVVRWLPSLQAGFIVSTKHTDLDGVYSGATFGQTSFLVDWILPQRPIEVKDGAARGNKRVAEDPGSFGGKLGFFVTTNFLNDRTASYAPGNISAPNFLLHGVEQFGTNAQLSWSHWSNLQTPVLDLNYTYLRQSGQAANLFEFYSQKPFQTLANAHAGMIRFSAPVYHRVSGVIEAGWNPTLIRADRVSFDWLFGLRFGAWPAPWQYRGQRRPVPVEAPPIRYELFNIGGKQ